MYLLSILAATVAFALPAGARQDLVPLGPGADLAEYVGPAVPVALPPTARAISGCDDFNRTTGLGPGWLVLQGSPVIVNNALSASQISNAAYLGAAVRHDAAVVSIDLTDHPMEVCYGAVMLGLGGSENLYVKVQSNGFGLGAYDTIGFYTGQGHNAGGSTGWGGFFSLPTPVDGGRVTVYVDPNSGGDRLRVDIDENRDGVVDQTLVAPDANMTGAGSLLTSFPPGTFGQGVGVGVYGSAPLPRVDDFELNGGCSSGPWATVSCSLGSVTVQASGCTPGGMVAIARGPSGAYLHGGPVCTGLLLDLDLQRRRILNADGNGAVQWSQPLGPFWCGSGQMYAQVIDVTTCLASEAVAL